ncbi:C-reactive protein-like [Brachionichthys hirsutus]|uniref:C-reactive protein-like n=1 Tax=Brachionichthys hirsutus TaxID=412623 RepID=UPI0036043020
MEKLLLLMVVFAVCHAEPKDMSGKVFVFPKEAITDYVKLLTNKNKFDAVTTCLRFQTDLGRRYSIISLATQSSSNDYLIFKTNVDGILMHVRNPSTVFQSMPLTPNVWHSLCSTWRSDYGTAQLWLDDQTSIIRYIAKGPISGKPSTILGQEQDSYGGGFDVAQSFVGVITDVHMWDHIIASEEIKYYMKRRYFSPGNVYNWGSLDYEIVGDVRVARERDVKWI